MGSLALATLTLGLLLIGALCGLCSMVVLNSAPLTRLTAFGWGAALGPIGVVVAAVVASKHRGRATQVGPNNRQAVEDQWL